MGIDQYISIQEKVKFWCLPCEKCVPEISDLNEHYKTYHERRRYCCVHCGIYLRMEDLWADHVRLFHSDVRYSFWWFMIEFYNYNYCHIVYIEIFYCTFRKRLVLHQPKLRWTQTIYSVVGSAILNFLLNLSWMST